MYTLTKYEITKLVGMRTLQLCSDPHMQYTGDPYAYAVNELLTHTLQANVVRHGADGASTVIPISDMEFDETEVRDMFRIPQPHARTNNSLSGGIEPDNFRFG